MEKNEYRSNADMMIYLVSCALQGIVPDAGKLKEIDLSQLFEVCQDHILSGCVSFALEAAGIQDSQFTQAKAKAIRKVILHDAERKKLLARMEQEQIWYMPLKGSILKDWYPKLGMRQMADNDILCDGSKMEKVRDIMLEEGYTCEEFGIKHHDEYFKPPVLNFEMHSSLFNSLHVGNLYEYYKDVKSRLLPDEGSSYGFHFSNEDFYLYFLAHEYKHFCDGGTGVRSLVDTYIILQKLGDQLDWNYIRAELKKLHMTEFEQHNRELAMKLLRQEDLSESERKILDYHIFSGVYGNYDHYIENNYILYGDSSKGKYLLYRIFPPYHFLQYSVPWVRKSKLLIPAAWMYRFFRGAFKHKDSIKQELDFLKEQ